MANAPHPRPETEAAWERYKRLPSVPKMVLQLKSLVFLPTNKLTFAEILTRSGAKAPEGRAWSSPSINVALQLLVNEQLLTEDLACVPSLLHPVAIEAIATTDGGQWVATIRRAFVPSPNFFYMSTTRSDPATLIRLARLGDQSD